jgi:hypothetical protein
VAAAEPVANSNSGASEITVDSGGASRRAGPVSTASMCSLNNMRDAASLEDAIEFFDESDDCDGSKGD